MTYHQALAEQDDMYLKNHMHEWITLSQHADLVGNSLILEDRPEICNIEQDEEDHGDGANSTRGVQCAMSHPVIRLQPCSNCLSVADLCRIPPR
jgi:hypothetical protein